MLKVEGFAQMLTDIENERGVSKEVLKDAIAQALLSACRRNFKAIENLTAKLSETGDVQIFAKKLVVEDSATLEDPEIQMAFSEAKSLKPDVQVGEEVELEVTPHDFGRFAATIAKQVIIQRIREAEKETAFDEYSRKQGRLVTGTIQKREPNGYLINLGRTETLLPRSECIPGEMLQAHEQVKLYVMGVRRTIKGPTVAISRTHPGLVRELFKIEVPEIEQGVIEIKGISREAGRRSKIAVQSHDKNVPAIGTCVGQMGSRIQNIIRELGNERIDIIEWNDNIAIFIANSLSPARILRVELDEQNSQARVIVPDNQLSLAIGRDGQNVRLAAKLTGWKIDIMGETQQKDEQKKVEAAADAEAAAAEAQTAAQSQEALVDTAPEPTSEKVNEEDPRP